MSIKLNQSLTTSLANCTLVKTEVVDETYDSVTAERVISWLAYSQVDKANLKTSDIPSYTYYLDAKLSAVRKTATFWDAYNIREVASTLEDFIQKYAVLPNNSSLIINTGSFELNGKTYQHGDIIIKDSFGQEVQVKNESNSGVYYPESITKTDDESGNLILSFQYGLPNEKSTIDLELPSTTPKEGTLYSRIYTNKDFISNSIELNAKLDSNKKVIIPFWECREWNEGNNYGDKIFNLVKLTIQDTKLIFHTDSVAIPFVILVK